MEKIGTATPDLVQANIEAIAELFPNVVTEALDAEGNLTRAVDFDQLRQELSDHVVDGPRERYKLDWPGKRAAMLAANAPTRSTLRPMFEESVGFENTKNIFIEGDNLEALKILQESYLGKVKLVYIDPPYNTGNDFIYDDNFAESTNEYLERSGQMDDSGSRLMANTESNGRFHSDWLSMMYPRLKLARNLLADDGFIFVSISDAEASNLKAVCNEIFGASNFVEAFVWQSIFRPSNLSKKVRRNAEYVLCYARNGNRDFSFTEREEDAKGEASLTQNNNAPRTLKFPQDSVACSLADGTYQPDVYGELKLETPLEVQNGRIVNSFAMTGRFKWQQEYLDSEIEKGVYLVIKSNSLIPYYRKDYQQTSLRPTKILPRDLVGDVLSANAEVTALMGEGAFDYPKPVSLVEFFMRILDDKQALVMDFFAGSGTTAQATLDLNAKDGGQRRWILVQIAEEIAADTAPHRAGFSTIAELSRARIARAADQAKAASESFGATFDCGFRSFRIDKSVYKSVLTVPESTTQIVLEGLAENVEADRSDGDLLIQVLLDWGLELSLPISSHSLDGIETINVDGGALIACFAESVSSGLVRNIATQHPLRVVFRDSGFSSDADRINAEQIFRELSPDTQVKVI